MKKHSFRRETQSGAKLFFFGFALLLVLTGCNVPTPPQVEVLDGTEQPTEQPTEPQTDVPTSDVTEVPTTPQDSVPPKPEEARFELFRALLEDSYVQPQVFVAETYEQERYLSWAYSLNVTVESGKIHLASREYAISFAESLAFEYGTIYSEADKDMRVVLDRLKNQSGYYVLNALEPQIYLSYGESIAIVEIDNALYFLALFTGTDGIVRPMRIHAYTFGTVPEEPNPNGGEDFEKRLKQDLRDSGFLKKYADERLAFTFFVKTDRFCAFFVERSGYSGTPSTLEVGGLEFHYANEQKIMVWCNGCVHWLDNAYNYHWIDQGELQAIYDGYLAVYPERKDPVSLVAEPVGGELSEEMQVLISNAMKAKTGYSWTYRLQNGVATYYGKFWDCYVVMDTPEMAADVVTTVNCFGYAFTFGRPFDLYVYCNGEIYTLTEAINLGKLTQSDVEQLYQFHTTYNSTYSN